MLLEYWGAPVESILSNISNMHRFCGNEEKEIYFFHVDLICEENCDGKVAE